MIEAIALTAVGFLAIFVDVLFLPGGLLVAGGVVTILYSIYLTFLNSGSLGAGIHFLFCLAVAPKLVNWGLNRVALKKELKKEDGYVATPDFDQHIGQRGIAASDLKPSGKVKIEGHDHLIDCQSSEGYIDQGTELIITGTSAGYLLVQKDNNKGE